MASDPLFPGMNLCNCDYSPVCGLPTPTFVSELYLCMSFWGFPGNSAGKESACNVGDLHSIPGLGRSRWKRNHYPLQYSGPENFVYVQSTGSQRVGHDSATFTFLSSGHYLLPKRLQQPTWFSLVSFLLYSFATLQPE